MLKKTVKFKDFNGFFWGDCFDLVAFIMSATYKKQYVISNKEDFIKVSGMNPEVGGEVYDKVVVPEYSNYVSKAYDPWSTNKHFYPNNELFAAFGLPMWNNKTAQIDISKNFDGDSKSEPNLQRAGRRWKPGESNFDGRSLRSFFPEILNK